MLSSSAFSLTCHQILDSVGTFRVSSTSRPGGATSQTAAGSSWGLSPSSEFIWLFPVLTPLFIESLFFLGLLLPFDGMCFPKAFWGRVLRGTFFWDLAFCKFLHSTLTPFVLRMLKVPHWIFFVFFFWPCHVACGVLVPRPGSKPMPPAVDVQSYNHCTAREVPIVEFSLLQYIYDILSNFLGSYLDSVI